MTDDDSPRDALPGARHRRRDVVAVLAAAVLGRLVPPPSVAAAGDAIVEVLLHVPVSGPTDDFVWFGIERMTLEPGANEPFGRPEDHGAGEIGFVVERGEVRFAPDGPAIVARKGTTIMRGGTLVQGGSVTPLRPGDQAYTPPGVVSHRRNDGPGQAVTLELSLTTAAVGPESGEPVSYTDPVSMVFPTVLHQQPPAPALLTLARVTLPPGGQIRVRDLPSLELLTVEQGALATYSGANAQVAAGLGPAPTRPLPIAVGHGLADISRQLASATIFHNAANGPTIFLAAMYEVLPTPAATPMP